MRKDTLLDKNAALLLQKQTFLQCNYRLKTEVVVMTLLFLDFQILQHR